MRVIRAAATTADGQPYQVGIVCGVTPRPLYPEEVINYARTAIEGFRRLGIAVENVEWWTEEVPA